MRRLDFLGIASVGFAAGACGLTADFSGLQDGPSKGQGGDRDAGVDAGVDADAASVAEGGADAAGFCASREASVQLCADFDHGGPVERGWSSLDTYGSATTHLDAVAFSPPGSFFSGVRASGAPTSARLKEAVPTFAAHVHAEFKMRLQPSDGDFELCALHQLGADGVTYGFFYKVNARNLYAYRNVRGADGGREDKLYPLGAASLDWLRVEMDVDVGDAGRIVVKHDGVVVLDEKGISTSSYDRTTMFVELGFYSHDGRDAAANFDDVVVDAR